MLTDLRWFQYLFLAGGADIHLGPEDTCCVFWGYWKEVQIFFEFQRFVWDRWLRGYTLARAICFFRVLNKNIRTAYCHRLKQIPHCKQLQNTIAELWTEEDWNRLLQSCSYQAGGTSRGGRISTHEILSQGKFFGNHFGRFVLALMDTFCLFSGYWKMVDVLFDFWWFVVDRSLARATSFVRGRNSNFRTAYCQQLKHIPHCKQLQNTIAELRTDEDSNR